MAQGEVIALRNERDGTNLQRMYYPRIRFRSASGEVVTFESGVALSGTGWQIGEAVPVRYRLDQPHVAECDSVWTLWGHIVLFVFLALVFLCVGLLLLLGVIQP